MLCNLCAARAHTHTLYPCYVTDSVQYCQDFKTFFISHRAEGHDVRVTNFVTFNVTIYYTRAIYDFLIYNINLTSKHWVQ